MANAGRPCFPEEQGKSLSGHPTRAYVPAQPPPSAGTVMRSFDRGRDPGTGRGVQVGEDRDRRTDHPDGQGRG